MLNVRKFSLYVLYLGVCLCGLQTARADSLPNFVDLVKDTSSAVVNISTTQKVQTGIPELPEGFEMPEFPEGSPFGELFKYFFDQEEHGERGYHDAK
jgi:serine protease Do